MKQASFCYLTGFLLAGFGLLAQNPADQIRLNQVGFYPNAPKIALVLGKAYDNFTILEKESNKVVYHGKIKSAIKSPFSEKWTQEIDFTNFKKQGQYILSVEKLGNSYPFEIKNNTLNGVAKAAIKGFYFQRVSEDLPERYAGKWARKAGHPDTAVLVHANAVSENRPEGTRIRSPRGWYDAGDYNKYIVNSGITMYTLLSALEDFPKIANDLELNIPESGNNLPDLLDEILVNLEWMLSMQDPVDGGVYHKLTNANFDGMLMPEKANQPRYVVQKNTIASLDFSAVMAQASRILKPYNSDLSNRCLIAAEKAWLWAKANPKVFYHQNQNNEKFKPAINTGGYEDNNEADEWFWAEAELFITTQKTQYWQRIASTEVYWLPIPSWNSVMPLGAFSLLKSEKILPAYTANKMMQMKQTVLKQADEMVKDVSLQLFRTVMGKSANDFMWGSSSHAANQAMFLLQAFQITPKKIYLEAALGNMDYLLGRNGIGYSLITGYGSKYPRHPHHRISIADGVDEPVPGLLSGGPNSGQQDQCKYDSNVPDESFSDTDCSYASNEIAINWNAPLVYLAMALESYFH
ncbi:MAG: glycoside hydrolase family 9 protein [Flectobacillus sp.]|uniref:glycoside hydrolase family 9 protein n=1 Tax=Flectobacillus sp. TaxID=50419 RepID=UPI003B9908EB